MEDHGRMMTALSHDPIRGSHTSGRIRRLVGILWSVLAMLDVHAAPPPVADVDFEKRVLPILKEACFECHGPGKQKGRLRLDQRDAAFRGGKNGPAIVPGHSDRSELYRRIRLPKDHEDRMPSEGDPLPADKVDVIRDWINAGAPWFGEDGKSPGSATNAPPAREKTDLELTDSDLLPPDRQIADVIDFYIGAKLVAAGVPSAPPADDATLLRRLTLDLAGRIPSRAEAEAYVQSKDARKRVEVTEQLLQSPWSLRHAATEFNALLRGVDGSGPDLRPYLLKAVRENRPWNRIFREILGEDPDSLGPEQFVTKRLGDPDLLTRDISAVLFGINLSCCQCHTHPYVSSLTQDYFLGMKNFFSRSYEFQGTLREKAFGPNSVDYKSESGQVKKVGLKFITGLVVEAPQPNVRDLAQAIQAENKRIEDLKKNFEKAKEFPPDPFFSLRREFVRTASQPDSQRLLARSIVNRLFVRFHGQPLVTRADQMHSENPASHPELLAWLTRDFMTNQFDLRRLIKGIVSSQTYSRSSRWDGPAPVPPSTLFAVASLRPLTPMQFGASILFLGNSDFSQTTGTNESVESLEKKIDALEQAALSAFDVILRRPTDGFQADIDEPLGLSNNPERLKLIGARLRPALEKLSDRQEQVETAVWTILGRAPRHEDFELLENYLTRHSTVAENERAELASAGGAERRRIRHAQQRLAEIELAMSTLNKREAALTPNAASTQESQGPEKPDTTPAPEESDSDRQRRALTAELDQVKGPASATPPAIVADITSRAALDQMIWSLVTSAEFRFNH